MERLQYTALLMCLVNCAFSFPPTVEFYFEIGAKIMFDLYVAHYRSAKLGGVHITPKHHLALHLFARAPSVGNPRGFANFYDEQLNATLKSISKVAYASIFERRVLSYFRLAHESELRRRV